MATATKKKAAEKAKKTVKKSVKKTTAAAEEVVEETAEEAKGRFDSIISSIRSNLTEAREALVESNSRMTDQNREIAMTLINNMQENADETFASLQDVVRSESITDTLQISRDSLRNGIERNIRQVKELAEASSEARKDTIEPMTSFVKSKFKNGEAEA